MSRRAREESAHRVSDCVTALLQDQPFFGSLALRLPIRADASRETLASDGHEIRYSPEWVAGTGADLVKTAIGRVVLACALKHHTRRGQRDPQRWQTASQLVTHGLLRDAGFKLPPEAEAWDGLSVEQAYDRLPEPQQDDGEGADEDNPPPSLGGGNGGEDNQQAGDGDDESGDDTGPSGGGNQTDHDDAGEAGETGEAPSVDPAGTGEIMDAGARSGGDADAHGTSADAPLDVNAEEQAWDEAMHQALNLAKAQGLAPGAVEEAIRGAHRSTLDWRSLLRRYMTDAAPRDYSWSVPNRRFIDSGLYLPSMRTEGMGTLAVIIDTSARWTLTSSRRSGRRSARSPPRSSPSASSCSRSTPPCRTSRTARRASCPSASWSRDGGAPTSGRASPASLSGASSQRAVSISRTWTATAIPRPSPVPVAWIDWSPRDASWAQPPPWGEHIRIGD